MNNGWIDELINCKLEICAKRIESMELWPLNKQEFFRIEVGKRRLPGQ